MTKRPLFERMFPRLAANRARHFAIIDGLRSFQSGSDNRLNSDWTTPTESADLALDALTLEKIRNRSRDLIQNDPHAAAAFEQMVTGTVGNNVRIQARTAADDVTAPQSVGVTISKSVADRANTDAENVWKGIEGDFDGNGQSFTEYLELVTRQELESGESITHIGSQRRRGVGASRITSVFTMIEPDRLMTPFELSQDETIRQGVKHDENGNPESYWISKQHPGDTSAFGFRKADFDLIPADEIIHSFATRRPGQTRGLPWLSPALSYFKHKGEAMHAELVAQRWAACISAYIETPFAADGAAAMADKAAGDPVKRQQTMTPGKVWWLSRGQKVSLGNPTRPGEQWLDLMHEILRAVGTAIGIPYVVLGNDFERVNYTSWRGARLQLERTIGVRRARLRSRVVNHCYSRVYDEGVMLGLIRAPGYVARKHTYNAYRMQWPGTALVDPLREMKADVLAVASGLLPAEEILRKYGLDFAEATIQIKAEHEQRISDGLPPLVNPVPVERQLFDPLDDPDPDFDPELMAARATRVNGSNGK